MHTNWPLNIKRSREKDDKKEERGNKEKEEREDLEQRWWKVESDKEDKEGQLKGQQKDTNDRGY